MKDLTLTVKEIAWHRNGISGAGFYLVRFTFSDAQFTDEPLLATVFPEPGHVAVINPTNVESKWRGDNFEAELRRACKQFSDRV